MEDLAQLDLEMTTHDAAITLARQWWIRAVRCGYAYAEVSQLHKHSPIGIWRRETTRAVIWGGVLPLVICFGTLLTPVVLVGTLAYFIQICRIAFTRGLTSRQSWTYALFVTAAKFAEFQGILKFYWGQIHRQTTTLLEYK